MTNHYYVELETYDKVIQKAEFFVFVVSDNNGDRYKSTKLPIAVYPDLLPMFSDDIIIWGYKETGQASLLQLHLIPKNSVVSVSIRFED